MNRGRQGDRVPPFTPRHPPSTEPYRIALTCPKCGGPVVHVTTGAVTPNRLGVSSLAQCTPCRLALTVRVTVEPNPIPATSQRWGTK